MLTEPAPAAGLLTVVHPGLGATVQDAGRPGHRHQGLPSSGWLDPPLAQAANALVGNPASAATLELRGLGTELQVDAGPVRVALAGAIEATWQRADGTPAPLPAWRSITLQTGDHLRLGLAHSGCAYLAVTGGLQTPMALGSRSCYGRAGLPGVLGRPLAQGDRLPCGTPSHGTPRQWRSPTPWSTPRGTLRVMLGPQDDHFSAEAVASLLATPWTTSHEQDRMGLRLEGATLTHARAAAADIVSDGVAPGAIQVPASGQPIVLLADSQTVGGYPKIATVIRADLPRLAHAPAGTALRFRAVDRAEAQEAWRAQQSALQRWIQALEVLLPAGFIDNEALYGCNLVSGMLRADP